MSTEKSNAEDSAAPRCYSSDPEWVHDIAYAMCCAIEFLENEEFSGDDSNRQEAAFREVAKRIARMMNRHVNKHC